MDSEQLMIRLAGLPVPAARWLAATGSTNADALAWAEAGAGDGSLVAADRQDQGRGRAGRGWVTHPGAALAFSLVLRLSAAELPYAAFFSPLGGLAVADALTSLGLEAEVKWPNDVLLERRKVCGVLAEAAWLGGELQALVLGIGVNVAPASVPAAAELVYPAACVDEFLPSPLDRLDLLRRIVGAVFERRAQIAAPAFLAEWNARLAFKGEEVRVSPLHGPAEIGKLIGVDAQGSLQLQLESGAVRLYNAGDVTLRPISGT